MPITFGQIQKVGDILSQDRFTAFFTNVPGDTSNGEVLSVLNVNITLPPFEVGRIVAKPFGWQRNFAGRRVNANSLPMSFYDNYKGVIHKAFLTWQGLASGYDELGGGRTEQYVRPVDIKLYDTVGKESLVFRANNAWPAVVTPTPMSEESGPAHVEVDLSVDSIDLIGINTSAGSYGFSSSSFPSAAFDMFPSPANIGSGGYPMPNIIGVDFKQFENYIKNTSSVINKFKSAVTAARSIISMF